MQIFKRKNPFEILDKIKGVMFLEVGKDSKVFKTIYLAELFSRWNVYIYSLPRENELRERIPLPHDIFLNLFKVRARPAKVIFVCCFRDPRGLLSSERDHVSPPNI